LPFKVILVPFNFAPKLIGMFSFETCISTNVWSGWIVYCTFLCRQFQLKPLFLHDKFGRMRKKGIEFNFVFKCTKKTIHLIRLSIQMQKKWILGFLVPHCVRSQSRIKSRLTPTWNIKDWMADLLCHFRWSWCKYI